ASRATARARLTRLEISLWAARRVMPIVDKRTVDEHLVGVAVDAERVPGPDHHIRILTGLEGADAIIEAERPCGIGGDPDDRVFRPDLQPCTPARGHRLARLECQTLPGHG